jgi:hypothetical protein
VEAPLAWQPGRLSATIQGVRLLQPGIVEPGSVPEVQGCSTVHICTWRYLGGI